MIGKRKPLMREVLKTWFSDGSCFVSKGHEVKPIRTADLILDRRTEEHSHYSSIGRSGKKKEKRREACFASQVALINWEGMKKCSYDARTIRMDHIHDWDQRQPLRMYSKRWETSNRMQRRACGAISGDEERYDRKIPIEQKGVRRRYALRGIHDSIDAS